MSHPQPPQRQPTPSETQSYARAIHNTALVALVACPLLALLPPRKLDFYTLGLVGTTVYSANYLVRESSGRSIWEIASNRPPSRILQTPQQQQQLHQQGAEMTGSVVGELQKDLRGQRDAWKQQRQREIREDVEEGKGFGDMIMDQIWEVWNWGKSKEGDGEEEEGS